MKPQAFRRSRVVEYFPQPPRRRLAPAEEREQAKIMAIALAQPHRRGNGDPRAGEPLWQFCEPLRHSEELYDAGTRYLQLSRQYKATIGRHVPGLRGEGEPVSEQERAARNRLTKSRYDEVHDVLRAIHFRCGRVVEKVCYDQTPPGPYDEGLLGHGLVALAKHFRIPMM